MSTQTPRHDRARPVTGSVPAQRGGPRPQRSRNPRVGRRTVVVVAGLGMAALAAPAFAYWLSSATATTTAESGVLAQPADVTFPAVTADSITVEVTPTAETPPPTSYEVSTTLGVTPITCVAQSPDYTCTLPGLANTTSYSVDVVSRLQNWRSAAITNEVTTSAPGTPARPRLAAGDDTGYSSTDNETSKTSFTVLGAASGNLAAATVELYLDSVLVGTTTAAPDGSYSIPVPGAVAEGSRVLVAKASYNGGPPTSSASRTVVVDTTAPTVPTAAFTAGCSVANSTALNWYCAGSSASLVIRVTSSDSGSGLRGLWVSDDGGVPDTSGTRLLDGANVGPSFSTAAGTETLRNLRILAVDDAGNSAPSAHSIEIKADRKGPTATLARMHFGTGVVEPLDTMEVYFSEPIDVSTTCIGAAGFRDVDLTIANTAPRLSYSASTGCPAGAFGTFGTGGSFAAGSSFVSTGTRLTLNADMLVLRIGDVPSGAAATGVPDTPASWDPTGLSWRDLAGNTIAQTPFTDSTPSRF